VPKKKSKTKNPAQEFFRTYQKKTTLRSWQSAGQHYANYVGEDQLKWLDIARALGCDFPRKVGHGRGGHDDEQGHAQLYYRGYVEFVIQAEGKRQFGTGQKAALKRHLNVP
jgi:hypothetical protein